MKKLFLGLFVLLTSLFLLVGCRVKTPTQDEPPVVVTPEIKEYTVTFNSDGGTVIESVVVEHGNKIQEPKSPTKEGYNFLGWYLDDKIWSFIGYVVTEDMTLVAKWEEVSYTITFENNGIGNKIDSITKANKLPEALPKYDIEGYVFDGWYYDQTFTNEATPNAVINSDVTLYAKWEKISNKISFDNKGIGVKPDDLTDLTEIPVSLPTLMNEGYNFLGWYTDENFSVQAIPGAKIESDLTLYAKWQELYDISFDNNDLGDEVDDIVNTLSIPVELPELSKEGYVFGGWYKDEDFKHQAIPGSVILSDTTLYAKWQKLYSVSFDNNEIGNDVNDLENVLTLPVNLPILEQEGFIFLGWYTDEACTINAVPGAAIDRNVTLYAKWQKLYDVNFENNNLGTEIEGINDVLSLPNKLPILTENGYIFLGWYLDSSFNEMAIPGAVLESNTTLYARWEEATFTVRLFDNLNSYYSPVIVNYGETLSVLSKEGYEFIGYYLDSEFNTLYENKGVVENTTLYAKFEVLTYNISFDNNDLGEVVENVSGVNKLPDNFPMLENEGYQFLGWYVDKNLTTIAIPGTIINSDITLYAKWEEVIQNETTFIISFDNNGLGAKVNIIKNVNKLPYQLPVLTADGYEFDGWYLDTLFTTKAVEGSIITKDTVLYAKWDLINYVINFDNNELGDSCESVNGITIPTNLPVLSETGYIFDGWFMDEELTIPVVTGTKVIEDITLYAKWQELYDITFNNNGYGESLEAIIDVLALPLELPILSDETKNFIGWYIDSEYQIKALPGSILGKDIILYAKWQDLFTITFNNNEHGESLESINNVLSLPLELPLLEEVGYNFLGWYTDSSLTTKVLPGSIINQDITLYAKWQELYDITFNNNGHGESLEAIIDVLAYPFELPVLGEKGYNFLGWYTNESLTNKVVLGSALKSNITLYAKWQELYDITYDNNGHGANVTGVTDVLTIPVVLPELSETGYYFMGWYSDSDLTNKVVPGSSISCDTVLYAKWEAISYAINFDNYGIGNSVGSISKVNYIPTELPTLEAFGYTFAGWYTDVRLTKEVVVGTKLDSNITLYAKWVPVKIKVTYMFNDEIVHTEELNYNSYTSYKLDVMGYKFNGWYELDKEEVSFNYLVPGYDVVLYASGEYIASVGLNIVNNILVSSGSCTDEHIVVPDGVTMIQEGAFKNLTNVKSIELPLSVVSIGKDIFSGCSSLEKIVVPFIGDVRKTKNDLNQYPLGYFFGSTSYNGASQTQQYYYGSSLTTTTSTYYYIPTSLKEVVILSGDILRGSFYNCGNITDITILEDCKFIGTYAFYYCSSLEELYIPDTVEEFGEYVLLNASNIQKLTTPFVGPNKDEQKQLYYLFSSGSSNSSVPSTLKEVVLNNPGDLKDVFKDCSYIEKITINGNLTSIGNDAFRSCTKLTEVVLPDSCTSIGTYAFAYCSKLTSISVPVGVTSIGSYAFYYSGIKSIELSDTVESIGEYAFTNTKLTTFTFPSKVTSVSSHMFESCSSLASVDLANVTSIGSAAFKYTKISSIDLRNITLIRDYAFSYVTLENIVLDKSITSIEGSNFPSSTSINVYFDGNLDDWLNINFASATCNPLNSHKNFYMLDENGDVEYLGNKYSLLTELIIPEGVTAIKQYSLLKLNNVKKIVVPNTVESIASGVFSGYGSVEELTLPFIGNTPTSNDTLGYIFGTSSFNGAQSVSQKYSSSNSTTYYIPTSLSKVTITGDKVKYGAFYGCSFIDEINLSSAVTEIADYAFYGCSELDNFEFPNNLLKIGSYTFYGCTLMTDIVVPNTVDTIGESAFGNNPNIVSISVPFVGKEANPTSSATKYPLAYIFGTNNVIGTTLVESYTYTTESGSQTFTKYYVPSGLKEVVITGLQLTKYGLYNFSMLSDVTLPEGIDTIPYGFLYNCKGLTSVNIPSSVKKLDSYALYGCSSLTGITLPDGLERIETYALSGLSSITEITTPESLTYIGTYAFSNCTNLVTANIPSSDYMGSYMFSGCSSLESLTIPFVGNENKPKDSTYINPLGILFSTSSFNASTASYQFVVSDNPSQGSEKTFYIPNSLKYVKILNGFIHSGSFRKCIYLETVEFGDGVTSIGESAFSDCTSLKNVIMSNSIIEIESTAFMRCKALDNLILSESLKTIGSSAFNECKALSSIDIPNSVVKIDTSAFEDCTSLTGLTLGENLESIGNSAFSGAKINGELVLPDKLTVINNSAFNRCDITNIVFNENITTIGNYAFQSNDFISLSIPSTIINIGEYAFSNCVLLTNVTFNGPIKSLGYSAFADCTALESVILPESIETIGMYMFYKCTSLKDVTFGKKMTKLSSYMFYRCTALEEVTLENIENEYVINEYTFGGCTNLVDVKLGNINSIGSFAFQECSNLNNIDFGNVNSIGSNSFTNCTSLTEVILPSSTTSVSASFIGCTNLKEVYIPSSVTSIADSAFSGCSSLEEITLPFIGDRIKTSSDDYQYPLGYIFGETSYNGGSYTSQDFFHSDNVSTKCKLYYIPETLRKVTVLGGYLNRGAFWDCSMVEEIIIESEVTVISTEAFKNCGVVELTLPRTLISIYSSAFDGCSKLTTVYFEGNEEEWLNISIGSSNSSLTSAEIIFVDSTKKFKVSFDTDGGNTIDMQKVEEGLTVTKPTDPTKTGYSFDGWYYDDKLWDFENDIPTDHITLTAKWTANQYTITYVPNGGEISSLTQEVTYDEDFTLYEIIKKGYTFTGYTLDGNSFVSSKYNTDSDITIEANFKANTYNINYYHNGENIKTQTVTFDSEFTVYEYTIDSQNSVASWMYEGVEYISTSTHTYLFDYNIDLHSSVVAYSGNDYTFTTDGEYATITGYTGSATSLTVPGKVKNTNGIYTVNKLGQGAFSKKTNIRSITLPTTLTSLGQGCFYETGITSITIPAGITSISDSAFFNCTSLKTVTFAEGSLVTSIEEYAFYTCTSLENITILEGVTSIGDNAFYGCANLTNVSISEGVESIGDYAFGNTKITGVLTLPSTLSYLGAYSFMSCESLEEVIIKEGLEEISYKAFSLSTSLTKVTLPTTLKAIKGDVFRNCTNLTTINLPNGLEEIGTYAFSYCSKLNNITIPETVTSLLADAFEHCTSLTSINIPSKITKINPYLFTGCTNLRNVNLHKNITYIGDYAFSKCSSLTEFIIPNNVDYIGAYAFNECTGIEIIKISKVVTTIYEYAFISCTNMTVYTEYDSRPDGWDSNFASGVNVVWGHTTCDYESSYIIEPTCNKGGTILYECGCGESYEEEVDALGHNEVIVESVPSTCISMGLTEGSKCSRCDMVIKRQWNTELVSHNYVDNKCTMCLTFKDSSSLLDFELLSDGTYIVSGIGECKDSTIIIPSTYNGIAVTQIKQQAFSSKTQITEVVISNSITEIGWNAFNGCYNLTKVYIPSSVTKIGSSAFSTGGYDSYLSIFTQYDSIPSGWYSSITSGGALIYYGVEEYRIITIDSLEFAILDDYAVLLTCTDTLATSLYVPGVINWDNKEWKVKEIRKYALYDLMKLKKLEFGYGVEKIGSSNVYYDAIYPYDRYELILPSTINYFDGSFVRYCSNLGHIDIYLNGTIEDWLNIEIPSQESSPFYVYNSGGKLYTLNSNKEYELLEELIVPESITEIGANQFCDYGTLKKVVLHDGVTSIGHSAFVNNYSLESINIPKSVQYMDANIFCNDSKLTVYIEASSKPTNWNDSWNASSGGYEFSVVWGHTSHTYSNNVCTTCGKTKED